jgi:hypothetical protein
MSPEGAIWIFRLVSASGGLDVSGKDPCHDRLYRPHGPGGGTPAHHTLTTTFAGPMLGEIDMRK